MRDSLHKGNTREKESARERERERKRERGRERERGGGRERTKETKRDERIIDSGKRGCKRNKIELTYVHLPEMRVKTLDRVRVHLPLDCAF